MSHIIKDNQGVNIEKLEMPILSIIPIVKALYESMDVPFKITCGFQNRGWWSYHNFGLAIDTKVMHIDNPEKRIKLFDLIFRTMPDNYDVVFEKDHIHIEYDPPFMKYFKPEEK